MRRSLNSGQFWTYEKAIVERLIREIKRRMSNSRMKGVYADRPLDPRTKRAARKAEAAAIHCLADAYRKLIEIIDDHNNRPHTALRRRRVLTQAGVPPTPKSAYLWGLQHLTGLRRPPMSDADYSRLLLSVDKGSISNGVLKYRGRPYLPTNEIGAEMAARSTRRAKGMAVRLDKTDPQELFVANVQGGWGAFQMTPGAAAELGGLSLDEEEAFASNTARLWARAEHEGRVERVTARGRKRNATAKRTEPVSRVGKRAQHIARESETADVKRKITGRSPALRASNQPPAEQPSQSWSRLEEQERLSNLEAIRRHRKKQ